ncbi:MAG: tetratricopeptide repeat protein [Proteobacteria bacterium]|nr:tetratricopeptide repeat protein [Pseudomonadota bacterium]
MKLIDQCLFKVRRVLKILVCISFTLVLSGAGHADNAEDIFDLGYEAFVKKDYAGAEKHWTRVGALGHPRAQNGLGIMYRDGDLGEARSDEAAAWFLQSANNGYAYAMFNLGMLYKSGRLGEANDIEAYRWLLLASTVNFDENAKFQANLLSQRMDQNALIKAREQAQIWLNEFFFQNQRTSRQKF